MVSSFHVGSKIVMQVVRKEKQLENSEDDKKLYQDNGPQGPAEAHAAKAGHIK